MLPALADKFFVCFFVFFFKPLAPPGKPQQGLHEVAQSCPTLCDPRDCSLPGSSVHGIFQASVWSGFPFPSPGDLPGPGMEPISPALAGGFFTTEPLGTPGESRGLVK